MRFFIHSVSLVLLLVLPVVSWAQRPNSNPVEPRERTVPNRTSEKPPLSPDQQSKEAAAELGLPKEESPPPLDQSIAADRPPGKGPPPKPPGVVMRRIYAQFQVLGSGIGDFYYIRQDILLQFSDGRSTGLKQVLNGGNYGPHPIGGTVSMVAGANYVLFPTCRGGISWSTHRLVRAPADGKKGQVSLSCRP
jgi:hypothetical protein